MKIKDIKPYEGNPRQIPEAAINAVADSIERYGFQQPIIIDADGTIIAGHTRLLAALKLGLKDVPVITAKLDEREAAALRITDNRANEFTNWDVDKLTAQVGELKGVDIPGFEAGEIEMLLEPQPDPNDIPDVIPEGSWKEKGHNSDRYTVIRFVVPRIHAKEIRQLCEAMINKEQPDRRK